jgi:hypothetical protein
MSSLHTIGVPAWHIIVFTSQVSTPLQGKRSSQSTSAAQTIMPPVSVSPVSLPPLPLPDVVSVVVAEVALALESLALLSDPDESSDVADVAVSVAPSVALAVIEVEPVFDTVPTESVPPLESSVVPPEASVTLEDSSALADAELVSPPHASAKAMGISSKSLCVVMWSCSPGARS